ncbi:hypothetical protein JCM33374_g2640 [Metschnikowia sp. JCM 33374]|nr:hypothetical protein JCM33374_g2640 [Metschnikowia sp. JCM 33374]
MFSKFLNKQKEGESAFTNSAFNPAAALSTTKDDLLLNSTSAQEALAPNTPTKRRWSYVTYLNKGTLHADDDNLMVGL